MICLAAQPELLGSFERAGSTVLVTEDQQREALKILAAKPGGQVAPGVAGSKGQLSDSLEAISRQNGRRKAACD